MITTYFKNLVMDNLFHTSAAKALPEKYYLAWSTTTPNEDGTGFTEPAKSTGYARIELAGLSTSVDGLINNTARLAFNEALSSQGTANEYGIFDSAEGGNLLIYNEPNTGEGDEKQIVQKGTTLFVKPNELQFKLKGM